MAAFTKVTYTPTEEAEINQWLTASDRFQNSPESQASLLETLNTHLSSRTTLLGSKPSKADVSLYKALAPHVANWTAEQRTGEHGYPHIVRHLDFVQNAPVFGLDVPEADKVKVNHDEVLYVKPPVDARTEKERLKKEKAAATAAASGGQTTLADRTDGKGVVGEVTEKVAEIKDEVVAALGDQSAAQPAQKKEKKEKAPKPQKVPAAIAPLSPSLIDLRVGHILKAVKHPEADSLYVSTIAMGDKPGTDD